MRRSRGAIQHMSRIVPRLASVQGLPPQRVEQTVSTVQMFQEIGALSGRLALSLLAVRIVARQRLLRTFLVPALPAFAWRAPAKGGALPGASDVRFGTGPVRRLDLHRRVFDAEASPHERADRGQQGSVLRTGSDHVHAERVDA